MIDLSAPAIEVAPLLLGATIWRGPVGIRLTEVEAYMGLNDPASHASVSYTHLTLPTKRIV